MLLVSKKKTKIVYIYDMKNREIVNAWADRAGS